MPKFARVRQALAEVTLFKDDDHREYRGAGYLIAKPGAGVSGRVELGRTCQRSVRRVPYCIFLSWSKKASATHAGHDVSKNGVKWNGTRSQSRVLASGEGEGERNPCRGVGNWETVGSADELTAKGGRMFYSPVM